MDTVAVALWKWIGWYWYNVYRDRGTGIETASLVQRYRWQNKCGGIFVVSFRQKKIKGEIEKSG